jgi:hypothetical protein
MAWSEIRSEKKRRAQMKKTGGESDGSSRYPKESQRRSREHGKFDDNPLVSK